jgi:hypothetical protein
MDEKLAGVKKSGEGDESRGTGAMLSYEEVAENLGL